MQRMKRFQIATKNHDGGSNDEDVSSRSSLGLGGGRPDAFSLYSNREVRMDRLLFRTTRVVLPAEIIPSETGNDYTDTTSAASTTAKTHHAVTSLPGQPPRRVTRLSFEVHPSLLLDPLILSDDDEMMTTGTRPNSIFDE